MVYGDELKQGIIRGREFIHPILKFRFTVPKGYRIINSPSAVLAMAPVGAIIRFDMFFKPYRGTMTSFLRNVWASKANLANIERITVNGMEGAIGARETRRQDGVLEAAGIAEQLVIDTSILLKNYGLFILPPPVVVKG